MPHLPPGPEGTPPVVPGYRLEALLGRGGSGEVWRAVPRDGGPAVAVKLLVSGEPEAQAREAALLGALDHPHLVRLREVVHQPRRGAAPRVALVLDLLEGGSLARLLAARGRLRPGEVVTALAPVAAALAAAHEQGVVHGDLSPGNVVFTAEGRPVLTDLGVARVLGEAAAGGVTPAYVDPTVARGGAPGPASDVFGVAAAAFHALTGVPPWNAADPASALAVAATGELPDLAELAPDAPPELLAVIARGLSAEPADRGSAAALALDLRHACRPEPVRLPLPGVPAAELARTGAGPVTELTHPRRRAPAEAAHRAPAVPRGRWRPGRRWRPLRWSSLRRPRVRWPSRRVVTGGVAAALVAVAAGVWAGTGPAPRPTAPPVAAPPASPAAADRVQQPAGAPGWQAVVAELYRRRAEAFRTGSVAPLDAVYAPASPLLVADRAAVTELAARGQVLRGFAPAVTAVTGVEATPGRAELRLVDHRPAAAVVTAGGALVAGTPARPDAPVRMVLVATPAGWRIESAELLAEPAGQPRPSAAASAGPSSGWANE